MLIQEIEKVRQAHCTGDDVDVLDARREAERIEQYIFEAQDNIRREEAGRVSDTLMNDIPPSLAKSMVTRRLRLMDREEKEEQQLKELKQWHGGAAVAAVDGGDGDENGVLTLNGVGNGGSDEVGVVGRLGLGVGVNIGKTLRTPTRRLGTQLTTKTLSLGKNPEQLRATLRALMVEDIMDLRANFDENEGKGEWTGVDEEEEVSS
ncbi:hypothetical protein B484DRAFT_460114 [Ochromonadaceae sp. CCMP2298]|nr:hypothetical protein B484DRAFT_460114 [Ochromonadaceae sp. CCMP2298]